MNTATKRLTAANVSMPWRGIGPVPDGTIDAGDRMGYANLYALEAGELATGFLFAFRQSVAIRSDSPIHQTPPGTVERMFTLARRTSNAPITSGTVNYFLRAKSGPNAGKYWDDSTESWVVAETGNPMTHSADGHWEIDLTSSPFEFGLRYLEYAKESGDLHTPVGRHVLVGRP